MSKVDFFSLHFLFFLNSLWFFRKKRNHPRSPALSISRSLSTAQPHPKFVQKQMKERMDARGDLLRQNSPQIAKVQKTRS